MSFYKKFKVMLCCGSIILINKDPLVLLSNPTILKENKIIDIIQNKEQLKY
jgi:hypothetical protein